MDTLVEEVIRGLSSLDLDEFKPHNLKDVSQNIEKTMTAIKTVFLEAEENPFARGAMELVEVLYDADDLLDNFSRDEALKREEMTRNKVAKKVRFFFSKSNQALYGRKMNEITKRLNNIYDKLKLKLKELPPILTPVKHKERRKTNSFVLEHEIIGREKERNEIISHLINPIESDDYCSSVSIVGIRGVGKTSLAQLVYDDPVVQSYFEPKIWVSVSRAFGARGIAEKILGRATPDYEIEIRKKLKGKRYLVVLDDVRLGEPTLSSDLRHLFGWEGPSGVIIGTTTSHSLRVFDSKVIDLKGLDDPSSWKLFSRMAFEEGEETNTPELVAIGKDIVKECDGVPLAIRTIGNLLYSRNLGESDWLYFRDSELPKIDEYEDKIFAILKLSYDHLPSDLKSCFVYCSLFPKDFMIKRETLIQLWVAQGFIQPSDPIKSLNVGNECFMNLLSGSFFQDAKTDDYGDTISSCKMHDVMHAYMHNPENIHMQYPEEIYMHYPKEISMHNLGDSVRGSEYHLTSEGTKNPIKDRTRHLSFDHHLDFENQREAPTIPLENAGKLRTFLLPCQLPRFHRVLSFPQSACISLISNLKRSRVLDLHYLDIRTIPKSLGELRHLRYLDLSGNYCLDEKLLQGITRLHNLQTLKLNQCHYLKELPRDIDRLVRLMHLELDECWGLNCMPHGLGQLTGLQTLTRFGLDERNHERISVLGGLSNLGGKLKISGLQHLRGNARMVESARLFEKQYLRELVLDWFGFYHVYRDESEDAATKDELILEGLKPSHTIKRLVIDGFCGKRLPNWIQNLSSLMVLEILDCNNFTSLPEWIGMISSLKKLQIYGCNGLTSLPEGMHNLRSLLTLSIARCPRLKKRCQREGADWPKIAHIPHVLYDV